MIGPMLVSPAVAGTLADGRWRLANMIVQQMPLASCRLPNPSPQQQRPRSAIMESAVLNAQAFLWKNDVHSADRLTQKALKLCTQSQEIAWFQHADWLFLARLAFLKNESDTAEMFLARAVALRQRHRPNHSASHRSEFDATNHCTELLLQTLLHLRQKRHSMAQACMEQCELQHQISSAPDLLRSILLTRCCVKLHDHDFQTAWSCFQAADILKFDSDRRGSADQKTVGSSQRLWIRQLAALQHATLQNAAEEN